MRITTAQQMVTVRRNRKERLVVAGDDEPDPFLKLLLNFDGVDGSTVIIDSSPIAHTVTNVDAGGGVGVEIDTAQSVSGGSSGLFNSTLGGCLQISGTNFALGTQDFAIDFRIRKNGGGERHCISFRGTGGTTPGAPNPLIYLFEGFLIFHANGGDRAFADVITDNVWYRCSITRISGETRLLVNDVQVGATYADANNYAAPDFLRIGSEGGGSNRYNGWLDALSIRIGTGVIG